MSPVAPSAPLAPVAPSLPAGSWPALKSAASSDLSFTFADVTAFVLICVAPTEFFGSLVAA